MTRPALAACLLALGACSTDDAHVRSDWEREHAGALAREQAASLQVAPPAAPREGDLAEFDAGPGKGFRFFVDRRSISVTNEGIIRYSLVAISSQGARNVSYEALSCHQREVRVHATGRADGSWADAASTWRPLTRPWHRALYRDYFCPKGLPITSAEEGAAALAQGGHALARQPNPVSGGGR